MIHMQVYNEQLISSKDRKRLARSYDSQMIKTVNIYITPTIIYSRINYLIPNTNEYNNDINVAQCDEAFGECYDNITC